MTLKTRIFTYLLAKSGENMFKIDENMSIFGFVGALKIQKMKEILFSHLESLKITGGHPSVESVVIPTPLRGSIKNLAKNEPILLVADFSRYLIITRCISVFI